MERGTVYIKNYTEINFRKFKPKSHLDYMALGMERAGLIVGAVNRAGRKLGGSQNSARLEYEGSIIREARIAVGISQDQLGELLNLSGGYVSFLENGRRNSLTTDRKGILDDFLKKNGFLTFE